VLLRTIVLCNVTWVLPVAIPPPPEPLLNRIVPPSPEAERRAAGSRPSP
jgi:hypothetical protein